MTFHNRNQVLIENMYIPKDSTENPEAYRKPVQRVAEWIHSDFRFDTD